MIPDSFKKELQSSGLLLPIIKAQAVKASHERNKGRDTLHLHPSELCKTNWCPRSSWYTMTGVPKPPEEFRFQTLNIFAEGNAIHNKYQSWLADAGVLCGDWICSCGNRLENKGTHELHCFTCGRDDFRYAEVPLYSEEYRLIGHADGKVRLDQEEYLIEIKSVGIGSVRVEAPNLFRRYSDGKLTLDQMWKEIKRPFGTHLRQGNLYMHATGIHKMIVLYEWKANQDVKEFVIRYQPELIQDVLDSASQLVKWMDRTTATYPRPDWANREHKACKACGHFSTCWEGDDEEVLQEVLPSREAGGGDARASEGARRVVRRRPDEPVL